MIPKKARESLPSRRQLDIQSRRRIIRQPHNPGKPIKAIPDRDIQRLTKDSVPLLRVGYHLCVSA
jgi:hypothetical protein